MQVLTKKQNIENFGTGLYGNSLRQWPNLKALIDSTYRGSVTMRYAGEGGGGPCIYDIPFHEVAIPYNNWFMGGLESDRIYFNETAPNHKALMQGELIRHPAHGYALHYSTLPLPMRDALRQAPQNHLGPAALLLAKARMTPASAEDFSQLLEMFPDSAIEFTVFACSVGAAPRRNTIIWEVRNY